MLSTEVEKEGVIHPCNGYILIQTPEERTDIIVIRDGETYKTGIVLESSDDETEDFEVNVRGFEWKPGDLVYFRECIEIDGHIFVHWTDLVAYKRL